MGFYRLTGSHWVESDTAVLERGEIGRSADGRTKYGNGETPWSSLPYATSADVDTETAARVAADLLEQDLLTHGAAYTQTYSTAARTVPAATSVNPTPITGGESPTEAEHNTLITALTATNADVLALKKLINALIDDGQAGVLPG